LQFEAACLITVGITRELQEIYFTFDGKKAKKNIYEVSVISSGSPRVSYNLCKSSTIISFDNLFDIMAGIIESFFITFL